MNSRHGVKYVQTSAGNYCVNPRLLFHHLFLMNLHGNFSRSIRNCINGDEVLRSHEELFAVYRVSEARGIEAPSCRHAHLDHLHIDFYVGNVVKSSHTESYRINTAFLPPDVRYLTRDRENTLQMNFARTTENARKNHLRSLMLLRTIYTEEFADVLIWSLTL
jgi:hypothetical protein